MQGSSRVSSFEEATREMVADLIKQCYTQMDERLMANFKNYAYYHVDEDRLEFFYHKRKKWGYRYIGVVYDTPEDLPSTLDIDFEFIGLSKLVGAGK